MNRTKTIFVLAAAVIAVGAIAFVIMRSFNQPSEPIFQPSTAQGIAPSGSDPLSGFPSADEDTEAALVALSEPDALESSADLSRLLDELL
jgi:hypothetical protein